KAEPFLRKLIAAKDAEATAGWARRTLALLLALAANYRQYQEALALVKERPDEPLDDRKTRALILATRPENRGAAIRLFDGLSAGKAANTPDVKYMLARLYEADGKWLTAKGHLLSLLESDDKNPSYL